VEPLATTAQARGGQAQIAIPIGVRALVTVRGQNADVVTKHEVSKNRRAAQQGDEGADKA